MRMRHAHKAFRLPVPALVGIVSVLGIGPWLDMSLPGTGLIGTGAVAPAAPPNRGQAVTVALARLQPAPPIVDPLPNLDRPPIVDPLPTVQPPACRVSDEATEPGAGGEWALAILDTALRLPPGYVPDDLVPVSRSGLRGGGLIRALLQPDLRALARAARAAGVPLTAYSARSGPTDVLLLCT